MDSPDDAVNEIKLFQSARWISPPEAAWRIFRFVVSEIHPPMIPLQLHLPNNQFVTFQATSNLRQVIKNDLVTRTMLTEFFKMNMVNPKAATLLYKEFPEWFVWNKQ